MFYILQRQKSVSSCFKKQKNDLKQKCGGFSQISTYKQLEKSLGVLYTECKKNADHFTQHIFI